MHTRAGYEKQSRVIHTSIIQQQIKTIEPMSSIVKKWDGGKTAETIDSRLLSYRCKFHPGLFPFEYVNKRCNIFGINSFLRPFLGAKMGGSTFIV